MLRRRPRTPLAVSAALLAVACAANEARRGAASTRFGDGVSELEVQALVMQMADDYDAALAETTYLVLREADARTRWLGMSFLRNGMGAALDIAAGPNPDIALLDLLVLCSLQTWAFEAHWIPAGIDAELGAQAAARLRNAERDVWAMAARVLSEEQVASLRQLVATWIAEHPDRTVVSFVRFDDFTKERELSTASARGEASVLLREVGEATAAVDDARLFGERALWLANRYPYVLGQQAELTAYRMADQPEVRDAIAAASSLGRLADALAERCENLEQTEQALFDMLRRERTEAVEQLRTSIDASSERAIADLAERVESARTAAVDHFFERLTEQREVLFAQIEGARQVVETTLADLLTTAEAGAAAGRDIVAAAEVVDRVLERFDRDPAAGRAPLEWTDLRSAADSAGSAADRLLALADRVDTITTPTEMQRRLDTAEGGVDAVADAFFWRGAALVGLLVLGLAAVRLVPSRSKRAPGGS